MTKSRKAGFSDIKGKLLCNKHVHQSGIIRRREINNQSMKASGIRVDKARRKRKKSTKREGKT